MWKCAGQRVRVFCTLNSCQSQCAHTFTRQYTCNGTIKLNYPSSPKSIFWHWDFSYSDHSAYTQVYDGEKENVVIYLSRSLLLYMYVNFVRTYISLPSNAQWDRYIYYDTFSIYTSGSGELTTHTHTQTPTDFFTFSAACATENSNDLLHAGNCTDQTGTKKPIGFSPFDKHFSAYETFSPWSNAQVALNAIHPSHGIVRRMEKMCP